MNEISDEQLRIQIAEWYGWAIQPTQAKGGWKLFCDGVAITFWWQHGKTPTLEDVQHAIPDFPNDLNAMRVATEKLSDGQWCDYLANLWKQCPESGCQLSEKYQFNQTAFQHVIWRWLEHATARQRALALVRTIKQEGK